MNKRKIKKQSKQAVNKIKRINVSKNDFICIKFNKSVTVRDCSEIFKSIKHQCGDEYKVIGIPPMCNIVKMKKEDVEKYICYLQDAISSKHEKSN